MPGVVSPGRVPWQILFADAGNCVMISRVLRRQNRQDYGDSG